MGFLGNVSNRIRDFFRNDKSQVAAQIAKGATAAAYPTNSYDILQSYGYDVLQDSLRLENDLLCVSGDTRVLVLNDGPKWVPIRDLAEEYKDKPEAPIYTLSFDTQSKRIVCSEAYRPRRTKHDQVFYVVMTGSSTDSQHSYVIKATADHPFLMRDGSTYCKVKDLKPGDSVMPAGVSVKEVNTWPYWYVFQPFELTASGKGSKQVKLAHLVVERTQGRRPGKGEVVHHINQDKLCDAPWNLEIKGINAHHADHSTELWADPAWRASQVAKVRASKSNGVCPTLETRKFGVRAPRHNIPVELLRKHLNESTSINEVARQLGVNWWTVRNHMSRHGIPMEELGRTSNHRVVAILPAGAEDVYDLTVPQYQNFAAEGVIIHNSKYVDYEEMGETPLIASALDIYADDASQTDSARNRTIWVTSQDQTIADLLGHDLFHKTLRMDEEIWEIARTMVSMGNDYEELLVTQDGVKGLNFLAPPTVRRIEGPRGELHGFIQDYKGRFGYSSAEFQQIMAARTASIRGGPDKVGTAGSERITALEDWEVVHFRLRSKHRRAVYGSCLAGDSLVWTAAGAKPIKDVKKGDLVFTRHAGRLLLTEVLDQVCSGEKQTYTLRTKHRTLNLTAEHPVLIDRGGKNNVWKPVSEVKLGEKLVLAAKAPATQSPPALGIHLSVLTEDPEVRVTERGAAALQTRLRATQQYSRRDSGLGPKFQDLGVSRSTQAELLEGRSSLKLSTLKQVFAATDLPLFEGSYALKVEDPRLTLPDFVEPWFARLFGFLLGDGWIAEGRISFARGEYPELNEYYEGLFRRTGLEVSHSGVNSATGGPTQAHIHSQALEKVFKALGWINGAHEKRLPTWIYTASEEIRTEFLQGFIDADGWGTYGDRYKHIELCNEALVKDLKTLIDGLGFVSGQIRYREPREESPSINGREIRSNNGSYLLYFRMEPIAEGAEFFSEAVESIDHRKVEPVYDIEVAGGGHNFIADGAVVHNSALESARWIWKRLMLLEDSALRFRLERAPERYAFYVDVGDLPPNEAMAYLNRVRQQHRKKRWVNPNTGKMDLRFDPMPVSDTTPIPLLDGRVLTIAEMCKEHEAGIKHWVYSVDPESKKMVPGEVSWVGQTRQAAPTVRITFDDGGYADMAPDHPVMRRSGEYAQAGSLQPGDSVMPLYREISSRARGNRLDGYELTYDPHSTHYRYTHRWVAEALGPLDPAEVVHHRDCSRLNNDPRNLQPMSRTEHTTLHASMGHLGGKKIAELRKCRPDLDARLRAAASAHMKAYNCSPEKRALTAIQNKKRDTGRYIRAYNASEQHERDNVSRSRAMTALWADPARREAVLAKSTLKFPVDFVNAVISIVKSAPHIGAEGVVREVNRGVYRLLAEGNTRTIPGVHRHLMLKMYRKLGYADFASFKSACLGVPAAEPLNHKVVSVEHIGSSDQYCMTVEKWHNFALLLRGADGQVLAHSGVVVRNSNDEDFVIPTRQGADGTRIEVLGSPSWQSVEDLNYFRDMLFAAIKVPRSYFSQEDGANKNTLSAGDVRFARTILRVQRELKNGLGKIARVHLAALNIDPEAVDYDIHMMVPSSIFELAQLEVKNARADLAGRMQGFVSMHWILSTVFGLSDDEIKVIFKEKEEDAARDANLQANTQSVIQRAVAQAGMEGQAAGQVASQDMMAQLAPPGDPNAPAAPAAAGQPAPQEGITGAPAIHIKGARPIKRLYGLEQKLFEGHNKAFENEARDKLNTIMRTDRRAAGQLKELGAMLRELNHAVKGIKR